MFVWIYRNEALIRRICSFLIIGLNLTGLIVVIKLAGYDALVAYSKQEGEKLDSLRGIVYVLSLVAAANIFFCASSYIKKEK
ncbi:hypothetical protein HYN59_16085 [Flavobacterium album]|uniref:Uncharacterized protein n=1 Tax=Flavobacterium album TaxID=2175091 RepID=A0A2S1R1H9_9FLAO|nr:hypothetical protein HYN59_16085 [Flavobacterium album]